MGLTLRQFQRAIRVTHKRSPEDYLGKFYAQAKYVLRQKQVRVALGEEKGNTVLLKWLGVQHLGQRHMVDILSKTAEDMSDPAQSPEPKGFEFVTPEGATVILPMAPGSLLPEPQTNAPKSQDDIVVVEEIIKQEQEREERPNRTEDEQGIIIVSAQEFES